jgi:hypothetical protein
LLGLSLLAACRGGTSATPDGPVGPGSDTGSGGGGIHIQDVQSDTMLPNTPVELHGVIVTAVDKFGARTGEIWVEEPGGGPYSGVDVFGAPLQQVTGLAVGDVVDITGAVKQEFATSSDKSGRTVTELGKPTGGMITITKTGTAAVPAPMVVDALAIGQKATQSARDLEWEKWEGVLITLNNISQFDDATVVPSASPDLTLQSFDVTGGILIESALAPFPTSGLGTDTCLASATGVLHYVVNYFILPRSMTEVASGGSACPPKEASGGVCGDGIDNDGNGFKDCSDNNCIIGADACRTDTTISAIQMATPTTPVRLLDVYVTGVAHSKKSFWVSTNLAAAPNEGVFVFRSNSAPVLDAAIVPGAKVNVIGTVSEFNDDTAGGTLTEVNGIQVTLAADSPATPVPPTPVTGQTAATLLDVVNAPTYESVLVTLDNVKITALGDPAGKNGFIATATQNATTFGIGTDIVQLQTADLACYKTVTGFWTNLEAASTTATTKPNAYGFIVRDLGTKDGTCP